MKKNLRILSLAAACTILATTALTGCGDEKVETSSTDTEPVAKEEKTNLPTFGDNLVYDPNVVVNDGKDITLKFWMTDGMAKYYEKWTDEYTKIHSNVKFEIGKSGWDDYWKKLPLAIQSGTGPDLFHMHNSKTDILLANMEAYPEEIFPIDQMRADFRQVDSHIIDDKLYYIDTGLMTSGIYYNKQMWADAGLTEADIPKTWDDLKVIAKKLTKTDDSGKITVNGFDITGNAGWMLYGLNAQKGIFSFKEDGKNTNFNNPETIKLAKFIQDLAYEDKVCDPKGAPSNESMGNQRTAMMYCWTWATDYLRSNFPDIDFGFFQLPTFDGKEPLAYDRNNGETSPVVSAKTSPEAQKVAFDFIKYIFANDEAMVDMTIFNGVAPSKYSIDKDPKFAEDPVVKVLLPIIDKTIWTGIMPNIVDEYTTRILNDGLLIKKQTPEEVLKEMDDEIAKVSSDFKLSTAERAYKEADKFNK